MIELEKTIEEKLNVTEEELNSWKNTNYTVNKEISDMFVDYIKKASRFVIIGDYDCDGVCSSYILKKELEEITGIDDIEVIIPKRSDGYGINKGICDHLVETANKDTCIITVDNGITAKAFIDKIVAETNATVLLTDHHLSIEEIENLPNANMIVNPHAEAIENPFETNGKKDGNYCGAGVIYKLLENYISDELRQKLVQYAALAQVADIIVMRECGWKLTHDGIEEIRKNPDLGIKELLTTLGFKKETLDEETIGFYLAPIINACGRIRDDGATQVFNFFDNPNRETALMLKEINEERKELKKIEVDYVCDTIETEKIQLKEPIVVYAPNLHSGIVGLVAGDVVKKYRTSAIVLTDAKTEGLVSGSCRSYKDFDMFSFLQENKDLLAKFGGHKAAAGLTLNKDDVYALQDRAIDIAPRAFDTTDTIFIKPNEINITYDILQKYKPFGNDYRVDLFGASFSLDERAKNFFYMGRDKNHLKITDSNAVHFNHDKNIVDFMGYGKICWDDYSKRPQMIIEEVEDMER